MPQAAATAKRKPFMSNSPPDTSPAGVVAAEAVLQNPATLSDLLARPVLCLVLGRPALRHASPCRSRPSRSRGRSMRSRAIPRRSVEAALAVGMLGLAQFLPMFALTLFAGHAADIYDRRKIMMAGLGVQLCTSALFGAMAYGGLTLLWPIYGVAALFGCARAFYTPSSAALAPTLVERRLIPRAIVLNSAGNQMATIVGPAIGGLLVAVSPVAAFVVSGALCLASLVSLHAGRVAAAPASSDRLALGADRRGLELCVDHQGRARRDQPRPVRGSARRRDGAPAGLCARHPACRAGRFRHPARRPVGRRDRHRLRPGRAAAEVACGLENVRGRRDLRALDLGVRPVALDGLERRGARDSGRGRHGLGLRAPERWCRS